MDIIIYILLFFIVLLYILPSLRFIFLKVYSHIKIYVFLISHPTIKYIKVPGYTKRKLADMVLVQNNTVYVIKILGVFYKLTQLVLDNSGNWYLRKFNAFHSQFGEGKPSLKKIKSRIDILDLTGIIRNGLWQEAYELKYESIILLCPPPLSVLYKSNRPEKTEIVFHENNKSDLQFLNTKKLLNTLKDNNANKNASNNSDNNANKDANTDIILKIRKLVKKYRSDLVRQGSCR